MYNAIITVDSKDRINTTINPSAMSNFQTVNQFRTSNIKAVGLKVFSMSWGIPNFIDSSNSPLQANNSFTITVEFDIPKTITIQEGTYYYVNRTISGTSAVIPGFKETLQAKLEAVYGIDEFDVSFDAGGKFYTIARHSNIQLGFTIRNVSDKTRELTGLSNVSSVVNPATGKQQVVGGYTDLCYTRYFQIVSNELSKYNQRDENSAQTVVSNIQSIWLSTDLCTGVDTKLSTQVKNIKFMKYQPSANLGYIDFRLVDEWGQTLYTPPNYNGNFIMDFMTITE